jgi:oxaloacetate decarboxylase gamma subunit
MQADVASALVEAANLLLVGMIVVFSFLTMLIGAIKLISWVNQLFPEEVIEQVNHQSFASKSVQDNQNVSPKVVAAISAAVRQYRRTK